MDVVCPLCGKKRVIKKGKRKAKLVEKQLYFCKFCKKRFVLNNFENKTYPAKIIVNAISYYNLGYSLSEVSKILNRKFKVKTKRATIHSWVKSYKSFCTYCRLREKASQLYKPEKIVFEKIFHYNQPYKYKYHKAKAKLFLNKILMLRNYLENVHDFCPNGLFFSDNIRCSCIRLKPKIFVKRFFNNACKIPRLALSAASDNTGRHDLIENFMLINDTATVAVEVPVWFWEKKINTEPRGIGVCGHIDILQLRWGKIYILDFKPKACKENEQKVSSQLYLYALGLSFRIKLPLEKFRCAWFDNDNYFEFEPAKAEVKW